MKKRLLLIMFSLSAAAVLGVSSCNKDDVFRSEQQTEAQSTRNFGVSTDLGDGDSGLKRPAYRQGPNDRWPGEKYEFAYDSRRFREIDFKLDTSSGKRTVSLQLKRLWPDADITQEGEYFIEIWDYSLENDWGAFKIWHERRVATMEVEKDYSGHVEMSYEDLFAKKGAGKRELWVYLVKKKNLASNLDFGNTYTTLWTQDYTESTKKLFDEFSATFPW